MKKLLMLSFLMLLICLAGKAGAEMETFLDNAMDYLRAQQQPDGSFGRPQPHLRTGLVMLALLSLEAKPNEEGTALLERAAGYLLKTGSTGGDLGDDLFNTESHSIAVTALICSHEFLRNARLREDTAKRIHRAVRHTLRLQDRSSSSSSRGGWKMEGRKGRANDRRASAWALVACQTVRLYGMEIPEANLERGLRFMLGSYKEKSDNPDQVGGFSVDTEGLAVDLISSMGGWVMSRFEGKEGMRIKNLDWLARNSPKWSGPNYFYSAFFRSRTMKFEAKKDLYRETIQRLHTQVADHQQSDGSVAFPPGNAQNTIAMGPVFSTAMSILIINVDDSRLSFDEDYRVKSLF